MVKDHLRKEDFHVNTAKDGEEGVASFWSGTYDLVIVDMMMPKLDGIEVIKNIRAKSSVPILIMSAKDSDLDKALGLGFGADDYIAKPFSLIELSARVKASIRRATQYANPAQKPERVFSFDHLQVDVDNFTVMRDGNDLRLTSKEFDILKLFVTNPNRVFTKEQIYGFVWNDDYFGEENVINVHIRRLREKIEDDPSNPKHIKTLWGIGYKWEG
jgi:DNA-binding response OmpR family regulator